MKPVAYAPTRLINKRPYGRMVRDIAAGDRTGAERLLAREGAENGLVYEADATDSDLAARVATVLAAREIGPLPHAQRMASISACVNETHVAEALVDFVSAGRQIVQFDERLTTEFRHTDLDGVVMADIELPWNALYLAFSGPDDMWTPDMPIEGCLVVRDEAEIRVIPMFTDQGAWTDPRHAPFWMIPLDASSDLTLPAEFEDGIDKVYSGDAMAVAEAFSDRRGRERADIARIAREHFKVDVDHRPILDRIVNLVGNALAYLSAIPAPAARWQDGAPAKLVGKASGDGKPARRAANELIYASWSQARHIGLADHQSEGGAGRRSHWRRGHWRRQPHGPGMTLRRLIRIRPVLIGGDRAAATSLTRVTHVEAGP